MSKPTSGGYADPLEAIFAGPFCKGAILHTYFFVLGAVFGSALLLAIDGIWFRPQRMRWEREVVDLLCVISQAVRSLQGEPTNTASNSESQFTS